MPLHVRSIAVSIAVICFFGLSLVCWLSGLPPFICCKRALIGAVITYIAAGLAIKAINAILTSAMITSRMKGPRFAGTPRNARESQSKQKDNINGGKD